jgi:hypothetical protein
MKCSRSGDSTIAVEAWSHRELALSAFVICFKEQTSTALFAESSIWLASLWFPRVICFFITVGTVMTGILVRVGLASYKRGGFCCVCLIRFHCEKRGVFLHALPFLPSLLRLITRMPQKNTSVNGISAPRHGGLPFRPRHGAASQPASTEPRAAPVPTQLLKRSGDSDPAQPTTAESRVKSTASGTGAQGGENTAAGRASTQSEGGKSPSPRPPRPPRPPEPRPSPPDDEGKVRATGDGTRQKGA